MENKVSKIYLEEIGEKVLSIISPKLDYQAREILPSTVIFVTNQSSILEIQDLIKSSLETIPEFKDLRFDQRVNFTREKGVVFFDRKIANSNRSDLVFEYLLSFSVGVVSEKIAHRIFEIDYSKHLIKQAMNKSFRS